MVMIPVINVTLQLDRIPGKHGAALFNVAVG